MWTRGPHHLVQATAPSSSATIGMHSALMSTLAATAIATAGVPPPPSEPAAMQAEDANSSSAGTTSVLIVSTSRFWHNYRHAANALSVYHTVKRLGVNDDDIIFMLADGFGCDARNPRPPAVFNTGRAGAAIDVYGGDVEVDWRGLEVTPENFIQVLTDRHAPTISSSKRLRTGPDSRVLIYLTGHGGDGFFKFQDSSVISCQDIADALEEMHQQHRYGEVLLIIDTCHAESLLSDINAPNVIGIGSSSRHEDSFSVDVSRELGVYTIDAFTGRMLSYMEEHVERESATTLMDMFNHVNNPRWVVSHPVLRTTLLRCALFFLFDSSLLMEKTRKGRDGY